MARLTEQELINTISPKTEGGQGDEEKMKKEFFDWIDRVTAMGKKAKQEMKSKGSPGKDVASFIGTVLRAADEEWYDFYWG